MFNNQMDQVLTVEQRKAGFHIREDDHCIYLMKDGLKDPVAVFTNPTIESLRQAADDNLNWGKSGISFEEECAICSGTGQLRGSNCPNCGGHGTIASKAEG